MIDGLTLKLGYVVVFNQCQNKYSEKQESHLYLTLLVVPNLLFQFK